MPEPSITILVLIAVVAIVIAYILMSPRFQKWWDQKMTDRKRKRAHEGKVKCESVEEGLPCPDLAVRLTPNGYFCEWHWEPMSVRVRDNGAREEWSHVLYYSVRVS